MRLNKMFGFMTATVAQLQQAIQQVTSQYYRLVILVGPLASRKTTTLESVAKTLDCQILNVKPELSEKMPAVVSKTQAWSLEDRAVIVEARKAPGRWKYGKDKETW